MIRICRKLVCLCLFCLIAGTGFAASQDNVTPTLQAKLDAIKARGLDYSKALAFWPIGEGEGILLQAYGTLGKDNPRNLISAATDVKWVKESRLKGQYCLKFSPPNSTINAGSHKVFKTSSAYTIEGWCRPEWLRGGGMIFHQGWSLNAFSLYVKSNKGKGKATASITQNSKNESVTSSEKELPGGWMHAACTYDGAKGTLSVFINGDFMIEKKIPWKEIEVKGRGWRIGGSDPLSGMGGQFNGLIDEVVIWDKVLTHEEIKNHYTLGKPDPGTEIQPVKRPPAVKLTATGIPEIKNVFFYTDFENSLKPTILGENNRDVICEFIRDCPAKNEELEVKSGEPRYRKGKFGNGLFLGSKGAETEKGEAVKYIMERLPEKEGAVSLWFKPGWEWGEGYHRLYRAAYTMLEANVNGDRIMGYAGQNDMGKIVNLATPYKWAEEIDGSPGVWHHLVVSWYSDGTHRVFLDSLESKAVYAPLRKFSKIFYLGGDNLAGTSRDTGANRPDAILDELTIFDVGLSPMQVNALYKLDKSYLDIAQGVLYMGTRTAFKRGEKIKLPFRCLSEGTFTAILKNNKESWVLLEAKTKEELTVNLDTVSIAPDKYTLEAQVITKTGKSYSNSFDIKIRKDHTKPIPFCALAFIRDEEDEDKLVEAGIHHVRSVVNNMKVLDRLYAKGLSYSPTLMSSGSGQILQSRNIPVEEWAQLWPKEPGQEVWNTHFGPSPFSKKAQEIKCEMLRERVGWCKDHPGVRYVNLYDEYGIRLDVSPAALEYFKKETGLSRPDFKQRKKSGIWPDNDPYIQWIDTFRKDYWVNMNLGIEDRVLTKELHRIAPRLKTFSTPSSGMGEIDYESVEIYPYLIEGPLVRGAKHDSRELMVPQMIDYYNAVQRKELKPQWPLLGWFNMPGQPEVNESIKLLIELSLAKGAQGVMIAPDTWVRNRPDMIKTVRELSDFATRYGEMLKGVQFKNLGTVAMLVSEYSAMSIANPGRHWSSGVGGGRLRNIGSVLHAAGIPYELVIPRQVLDGRLDSCEALILTGYTQTKKSLHDKILAFENKGGVVFHDEISWDGCVPRGFLIPQSSTKLPWRTNNNMEPGQIEELVPLIKKMFYEKLKTLPILSSNSFLVNFWAKGDDCQLYFVINRDILKDHVGEITVEGDKGVVYDLMAGTLIPATIKDGRLSWNSKIEKGSWNVYMRRSAPISKSQIKAKCKGSRVAYTVQVSDKNSHKASNVPLEITVTDPSGKLTKYGTFLATDKKGIANGDFYIANITDTEGKWQIQVKELLSGMVSTTSIIWNK